jgi:hypothetical protein
VLSSPSNKKLGFQKRVPFRTTSNNLLHLKIEETSSVSQENFKPARSLNKYYLTILSKKSIGKKHFFYTRNEASTAKSEEMSIAEKLELIREEAQRKTATICRSKSPFMTEARKEAIYSCQVLRNAKRILKPSEMERLQLCISNSEGKNEEERPNGESRREKQEEKGEAEEILQKNNGRIKAERKRIIEKMVC